MNADATAAPARLQVWLIAIRPRTLSIAMAPVLVGTALAHALGARLSWGTALLALACAVLIQAATNLHNDAADFERGNDPPDRLGPLRVTSAGWASAHEVRRAAYFAFASALAIGMYLVWLGSWPILAIGLASLAAGWAYSGGRHPISHTVWGEFCVVWFFGVLAVWGTAWLQGIDSGWRGLVMGVAVGLPAGAVLLTNNLRDREADTRSGRRTLAAVLGDAGARRAYGAMMLAPFVLLLLLSLAGLPGAALGVLALPLVRNVLREQRQAKGAELKAVLAASARAGWVLALLATIGLGIFS